MAGNSPCDAPLQVLTTPEVFEFGPSSLQDETDIINAVEAEYARGGHESLRPADGVRLLAERHCRFGGRESALGNGIPQDDLHFVFIGDPSDANGIATNIYADLIQLFGGGTTGTTLTTTFSPPSTKTNSPLAACLPVTHRMTCIRRPSTRSTPTGSPIGKRIGTRPSPPTTATRLDALGSGIYHFFTTHVEYLGLTPADVASGVATTDDLTTTITIPDGSDPGTLINDPTALVDAFGHGIADSGAFTALLETVEDLFNPCFTLTTPGADPHA